MKKSILNLKGAQELSRAVQKNVFGGASSGAGGMGAAGGQGASYGGGCAYLAPTGNASGGPVVTYGVSRAEAEEGAGIYGGRWCCDSCSTASWYGI